MRPVAFLLLLALSGLSQIKPTSVAAAPAPAAVTGTTAAPRISWQTFTDLERGFDGKLSATGAPDPISLVGNTRGLYLAGCGVIFTTDAMLVTTIGNTPFHQVTPQEKIQVHQRKLDRLPLLKQVMVEMMKNAAGALRTLPETDQVVVAVRLFYLPWEDTTGLPGQVLMRANRKAALAGDVKVEVE